MSVAAKIRKLRLSLPTEDEIADLMYEIRQEKNDRSVAILCANLLDMCLMVPIGLKFVNQEVAWTMFKEHGILYNFDSKITIAYAMGIFGDTTKRNFDLIKMVRNLCAHTIKPINFKTNEVSQACMELEIPPNAKFFSKKMVNANTPRGKFIITSVRMAHALVIGSILDMHGQPIVPKLA